MSEYLNSARAENFIGRQWLYREIENILASDDISGVLIIGNPGTGKSALSSQLICSRTTSSRIHSRILGYHLCKYSDKNTQMAGKFVRNLAEMIARRLPEYGYLVSNSSLIQRSFAGDCIQNQDPGGCFEQAIIFPLRNLKNKPQENWYIVLDALDECVTQGSEKRQSIVHLLNNKIHGFPPWLKLVMTSRNESDASLHSSKIKKLIIDPEDSRNLEDIELFVTTRLYQGGPLLYRIISWFGDDSVVSTTKLVTALLSKSQGNFLFVKEVLHHWELSKHELKDAYALPKTLGDLYHSYFQRLYPETRKGSFNPARRILELLVAAIEPLPQKEIFHVLRMKEEDLDEEYGIRQIRNRLKELGHFLKYGENDTVTLYHLSLAEWLTSGGNEDFFVSKKKGHEIFCDYYFSLIRSGDERTLSRYILSLAQHIAYGGWKEAYVQEFLDFPSQVVNSSDPHSNRTLLHLAATINSTDVLKLLLGHFSFIDCVDNLGMTPAFLAAKHGLVENLALLVKKGANVNRKTNSIIALYKGNVRAAVEKAKYEPHQLFDISYREMAVNQSKSNFINATMLHAAAQRGHVKVVQFLLDNNVVISTLNGAHQSAIQLAAENGHLEVVKVLHAEGAVTDQTALHHAAANNRLEVVNFLLDVGVKDECLRCDGTFHWLKTKRRFQSSQRRPLPLKGSCGLVIRSLENCIDWEKNWEEVDIGEFFYDKHLIFCHSALHAAVASEHDKIVSRLLSEENNALSCTDYTGRTPLHEAVRKNNTKIAEILLEKQSQLMFSKCEYWQRIDAPTANEDGFLSDGMLSSDEFEEYNTDICHCGYTPLHLAAQYGHEHLGILLIIEGALVDDHDCSGATPLHVAACHNQVGLFYIFLHPKVAVDINSKTLNGSTPLHSAAACGATKAINYLIYYKANLTAADHNGMTALHYSVLHAKSSPFNQVILRHDKWFYALFHLTRIDRMGRFEGNYGIMEQTENKNLFEGLGALTTLVLKGSDIDAVDNNGQTPLHLAVQNGLSNAVAVLLNGNTTLIKRDKGGKTPLELAVDSAPQMGDIYNDAYVMIVDFLLSYGASFRECNQSEKSLLHRAIIKQQPHIVQHLLLKGASLTCKDNLGRTPLVTYLQSGGKWTDVIINAFTESIDIKCGEPFNSSVLHLLSYRPPTMEDDNFFHSTTCKFYNPTKCKVAKGSLAEAIASHPRNQEIINSCLDAEGFTPLHRAAQGANVVAIRFLLANGADYSILSPHGHDSLTLAVLHAGNSLWRLYGGYNSEKHLLGITQASDAAIELLHHVMKTRGYRIACDSSKPELTIYHLAASRGLVKFIEVLLKERELHQLDVDCPNRDGITPMYLAKIFGNKVERGLYNPWEHVVDIIKSHGGEMQFPARDAEYNVIYSRLYGWIPNDFAVNLRPDIRHLMTSLLTQYEKKENKSFHCAVGVSLAKRDRFKYFNCEGNSLLIFLSIWEGIKMHLDELRLAMDYNKFQRIMTDTRRCSWKHDQLDEYFSKFALHKMSYRQNISKASNWESLKNFQMSWFQKELQMLMRARHKEIFGCFACTKLLFYNHKALTDRREIKDLIQRYEESPPTFHLTLVCEILHSMFVGILFHHLKIHALVGGSELCTTSEFVSERRQILTGGNPSTLLLGHCTIKEYDWPVEFLVKHFLGIFRRFDYLRSLNVGTDQSTHVLLGKETVIPDNFLQLHRTLTQIYYS